MQTQRLDHILGDPIVVDYFWGQHLRARCCPCIIECITFTSTCNFPLQTLLYRYFNKNCNILYLEHLIYGLYVCTCVFLLRQKSFDMILVNNPSSYDGGVTVGIRARFKVKCTLTNLKNDQQRLTLRKMFYPYKDYSSFVGGKLTMFKLCNYGFVLTKVCCDFLDCFELFCCLWSLFYC
jgi:hypothetical protein